MAKETKKDIDTIRSGNPGHTEYELPEFGTFIFGRPPRAGYNRFVSEISDDKKDNVQAMHKLVRASLLYPTVQEFEALIDYYPAFLVEIATELQAKAGGEIPGLVKKGG